METFWKLPTHGEHRSMLTKTAVCSVKRAPKRRNFLKPVKRSDAAALARLAVRTPYLSRIPQLGLTESAIHNFCAAKSTDFCLSALIDQCCFEGMLEFDRNGVVERKIILKLRRRTPSRLQDCALPALSGLAAGSGFTYARTISHVALLRI